MLSELFGQSGGFWSFVINKRRNDVDIPSTMSWKNVTASICNEVSSLFESFFEYIYQTSSKNLDLGKVYRS